MHEKPMTAMSDDSAEPKQIDYKDGTRRLALDQVKTKKTCEHLDNEQEDTSKWYTTLFKDGKGEVMAVFFSCERCVNVVDVNDAKWQQWMAQNNLTRYEKYQPGHQFSTMK